MTVKVFGQLNDITGLNVIEIDSATDTDALVQQLQTKFPMLKNSKYKIAVNKNIVQSNTALQQDAEVALLPPFSGG